MHAPDISVYVLFSLDLFYCLAAESAAQFPRCGTIKACFYLILSKASSPVVPYAGLFNYYYMCILIMA